jgi:flagellar biosynthesis protein FlhG
MITRESQRPQGLVTVAVTSGKGGVGKTNVVVNLAVALARLRHRVAILDADFGLGNVDVMLGLAPAAHLGSVLAGAASLDEVIVEGPLGVKIIPSSSGVRALTALSPTQWDRLRGVVDEIGESVDFLIIDTASGISDNAIEILELAKRVLVVTAIEPTAVVDAYAVIKLISASNTRREIGLLVNGAMDGSDAQLVFAQLEVAVQRFLKRRLTYYGFIAHDPAVRDAILMQRPIVDHMPQSSASRCFRMLAARFSNQAPSSEDRGLRLVARPAAVANAGAQW